VVFNNLTFLHGIQVTVIIVLVCLGALINNALANVMLGQLYQKFQSGSGRRIAARGQLSVTRLSPVTRLSRRLFLSIICRPTGTSVPVFPTFLPVYVAVITD
jgi:hypothetical protein